MLIKGLLNGKSLNTSTISSYLEITDNMEAFVSINMKKYHNNSGQNDTNSEGTKDYEITDIVLYINGSSKYGPLRFPNTTIDIKINRMLRSSCKPFDAGLSDSGVHMLSTVNEETKLGNFVVFAPNSGHFLEVRLSPKESYGMLSAKARLFGEVIPVSVKIQNSSLRFSTIRLNVFQQFPAIVNVSGQLKPWEKLSLRMRGVFDNRFGEKASLLSAIEISTNEYIQVIVTQVGKRMAVTQKAQQLAESRANKTKLLLDVAEMRLQNANALYLDAVRNLSLSTKTYTEASRMLYINTTSEFNDTVKILENLCAVNECPFECVPGSMCSMCDTNITGKIRNLCQGACYHSAIERRVPFGIWKKCKKDICKNVTAQRDEMQKQSSIKCGFTSGFGDFVSNLEKRSKTVKGVSPSVIPEWLLLRTKKVLKFYLATGRMRKAEETVDDYTLSKPSAYSTNKMDSQDAMKCRRKSVNYWQCSTISSSCYTNSYNFHYKNVLYPCETSCEIKTQTESISTPCCKKTSCVTRVKNMACRKRNIFCHIIRDTAIEKLSQAKQILVQPYKSLLDLQRNIYKAEIEVERRRTNLQTLTTSRDVLQKSYQSTSLAAELSRKAHLKNKAKMGDALMLAKKWQSKTQAKLVTVTMASFDIVKDSDVSSVPVEITTSAEGVVKKFNIMLKSKLSKSFLHNASRTIASSYYGKISAALRDEYKMMIQDRIQSQEADENQGLDGLIKLKRKCSLSVNYERGLSEVMRSLYNVTKRILKTLTDVANVSSNGASSDQGLPFDRDAANKLGLTSQDIDLAKESIVKQQEIIQANSILELINASTFSTLQEVGGLVFSDWFAVMEKLFYNPATVCNGFTDCMQDNLDNIFYLYDNVTLPKASYLKSQIFDVRQHFTAILNSFDFSAKEANVESKSVLDKLEGAKDLETFCASAPNVTKQPNAINEINVGNQLTLKCLAVGVPAPSYQWKKDGKVLQGRVNNDLFMESVRNEDSGNYTCVAYNHVALIESAPSLVIVHSPPMITKQPPSRLSVTMDSDFYLECEGSSKSRPIEYQWYFKKGPNDAYNTLAGQTYPIYSVNRANNQHQGIYKCQISNIYGSIDSQDTLITVLDFELVRPGVLFTAHIRLSTVDHEQESKHGFYSVERGIQETNSEETVNIFLGNWICPLTSLTSDCVSGTRLKRCYPDVNGAGANATICESTFVIRSTNTGSFNLSKTQAEQNANNVEDSVTQLSKAVTTLLNATSRETHTVNIGTTKYKLMKNSVSALRFLGICDQGKQLNKNEYMCGK